jgi:spore germination protein KB
MKITARISSRQLLCLITIYQMVGILLFLPATIARIAGPDAWLAIPVGVMLGGVPVALLLGGLYRYHPRRGFSEIMETCLGKWMGKAASLIYALFVTFLAHLIIRITMDFASVTFLPGTPLGATGLLFTAVVAYTAFNGAEGIARIATLSVFLFCLGIPLLFLGLWTRLEPIRILPILGDGVLPVFRAAQPTIGWFAEMCGMAEFLALVRRPEQVTRQILWGNALASAAIMVVVASALMTFGSQLTQQYLYPTYDLSRLVAMGEFLERLEVALLTVWLFGQATKAATCVWTAAVTTARLLGLRTERGLTLLLAASAFSLTFIWPGAMELVQFDTIWWTPITLPLTMGLPALLLLLSWWQRRRRRPT